MSVAAWLGALLPCEVSTPLLRRTQRGVEQPLVTLDSSAA